MFSRCCTERAVHHASQLFVDVDDSSDQTGLGLIQPRAREMKKVRSRAISRSRTVRNNNNNNNNGVNKEHGDDDSDGNVVPYKL